MNTPMLTTVHLVGELGQEMGRAEWHLDVKSVAEAVRAININTRGKLGEYLSGPAAKHYYRIGLCAEDNVIDPTEASHRSGRATIFIMPAIKGSGNSGLGKAILGIGLIALAFMSAGASLGAGMYGIFGGTAGISAGGSYIAVAGMGAFGTAVTAFGVSLLLGGISQMLSPKAQGDVTPEEQRASTTFPGNTTAVVQGGIIPVVYGRALVSPTPISVTVTNNQVTITNAGQIGEVDDTTLDGGGTQYGDTREVFP